MANDIYKNTDIPPTTVHIIKSKLKRREDCRFDNIYIFDISGTSSDLYRFFFMSNGLFIVTLF